MIKSFLDFLGYKKPLSFSEILRDPNEPILKKYNTVSLEQALRRAAASVFNEEGLNDIKYLIDACKVYIHASSDSGKTPLELCVEYALKKLNTPINENKQAVLKAKLKAISYLLTKNESFEVLRAANKIVMEFSTLHLKNNTRNFEVKLIYFILNDLFNKADCNLKLQKKWEEEIFCKSYSFQPILLCETHVDAGSTLFAKHLLPRLKQMGYKMIGMEAAQGLGLDDCLNLLQDCVNNKERIYLPLAHAVNKNMLIFFKALKKQDMLFENIDINVPIEGAESFVLMSQKYDLVGLGAPLRDKGMFYNLSCLAAKYDGAVVGIVGGAHGLPITQQFTQHGMAPTEWLKVIPYRDPSVIGVDQHGEFTGIARALLQDGALALCLDKNNVSDSITRFFETLKTPELSAERKASFRQVAF